MVKEDVPTKGPCERFTSVILAILRYIPIINMLIPSKRVDDVEDHSSNGSGVALESTNKEQVETTAMQKQETTHNGSKVELENKEVATLDKVLVTSPLNEANLNLLAGSSSVSALVKEDSGNTVATEIMDSEDSDTEGSMLSEKDTGDTAETGVKDLLPCSNQGTVMVEEDSSSETSSVQSFASSNSSSVYTTPVSSDTEDDATESTNALLLDGLTKKFYPNGGTDSDKAQLVFAFAEYLLKEGHDVEAVLKATEKLFKGSEEAFEEGNELAMAFTSFKALGKRRKDPLHGQDAINLTAERVVTNMRKRGVILAKV